ncbi:MAG: NAD(P)/FAD-dependent oxidoreductase [Planctomycetes bacterium]|nr:NAD(P)/FAD-dependent oxidoreductase [Planctomycetota bacterium]
MSRPWDVIVVGAGAAGLLAAIRAAELGRRTLLIEKNRKPGVKILMSGGTRCNLTHATDKWGILEAFGEQGRFLHSALAALGPADLVELFEAEGVATKVESTGKVFPVSDKATDVLHALRQRLARSGAEFALGEPVVDVTGVEGEFVVHTPVRQFPASRVLITSGGQSYPGCGTTGDGYAWAKRFGHTIIPPRPALAPLTSSAAWVHELRGVTIPDVLVRLHERSGDGESPPKPLTQRRGSFLFTHFGLSGPAPMDVSRAVTGHRCPSSLILTCDFLPDASQDELLARVQKEAATAGKRQILGAVSTWLPRRLAESLFWQAGIPLDRRGAELSRVERRALVEAVKATPIPVDGTLGFKKAEVTAGGVTLDEIDSRTMQSKLVPGLFFAGEVLDLDGPIGGYNFQSAFSTGWLAGGSSGA